VADGSEASRRLATLGDASQLLLTDLKDLKASSLDLALRLLNNTARTDCTRATAQVRNVLSLKQMP
jgi:hypothetical protein